MNKIVMNIRYKISYQFSWMIWSLGIYLIAVLLVFYPLIKFSVINPGEGSLVYRLWVFIIVQFAITMKFQEDFDFLLTLSNTRKDIFLSLFGVAVTFSTFISGLIVLERVLVDYLNDVFEFNNIIDPFHFVAPYITDNLFVQFVFFFILSVCSSVFALLIGSLFYRFGKKFIWTFWLLFSAIPTIFFPLLLWKFHQSGRLSSSLSAMGEFLRDFNILAGSGYLLIFTIIFSLAAFLSIRRLGQK